MREGDIRDADRFSVAADECDSAGDLHGGERDDERVDAKLCDDKAVDESHDAP